MTNLPTVTGEFTLSNSFLGDSKQICVVTRDLQRTMRGMVRVGIGPWMVYTFSPDNVQEPTYRGQPANFSMKLALSFSGTMMWEIVQPLTGPNIYEEFLEKHEEGVHHVAFTLNDIPWEDQVKVFQDHGYELIQSGIWEGRVPFAYFETEQDTTTTFEIFNIPDDFSLPEPEQWYPAAPPAS